MYAHLCTRTWRSEVNPSCHSLGVWGPSDLRQGLSHCPSPFLPTHILHILKYFFKTRENEKGLARPPPPACQILSGSHSGKPGLGISSLPPFLWHRQPGPLLDKCNVGLYLRSSTLCVLSRRRYSVCLTIPLKKLELRVLL